MLQAGYLPSLQIHDELCFNLNKDKIEKQKKEIKKIMEECIDFKVPFTVDCEIGNSWGNLK